LIWVAGNPCPSVPEPSIHPARAKTFRHRTFLNHCFELLFITFSISMFVSRPRDSIQVISNRLCVADRDFGLEKDPYPLRPGPDVTKMAKASCWWRPFVIGNVLRASKCFYSWKKNFALSFYGSKSILFRFCPFQFRVFEYFCCSFSPS
jgi:hypothetical protein